ncbi:MAG: ribosome biogenesis factor YjgA [Desulfobacterales bacterium]|jgi:ribosome-associated protein
MTTQWERKSKTRKKKDAHAAQQVGERLVDMPDEILARLQLPQGLLDALRFAKSLKKRGARRRQMQYIGTLMRHCDPLAIDASIAKAAARGGLKIGHHRQLEAWRDQLVVGDDALMERLLRRLPKQSDRDRLAALVQSARKEKADGAPPKHSRLLFRHLRSVSAELPLDATTPAGRDTPSREQANASHDDSSESREI